MDKPNKNKHVESETRAVITRGEGGGGEDKRCKGNQLYGNRWKISLWCETVVGYTEVEV